MNKFACFIFILLIVATQLFATTYYIDATNGSDSNTGTSPTAAWKTIAKVNNSSFNPGDFILFKRGQVWREMLIVSSSGSLGNPITFGAYGSGNNPLILGSDDYDDPEKWLSFGSNKWATAIGSFPNDPIHVLYNTNDTPIRAIKKSRVANLSANWNWWYDSTNDRVVIYHDGGNPADQTNGLEIPSIKDSITVAKNYITIDGIDIKYPYRHGVKWSGACSDGTAKNMNISYTGNTGIYFDRTEGTINCDNIVTTHTGAHGIAYIEISGGTIQNCNLGYHGEISTGHALDIYKSSNLTIQNNKLHHALANGSSSGIGGDRFHDCIIQNNEIYNNKTAGIDLSGFEDGKCYNNIVRYNLIHDNDATNGNGGILINGNYGETDAVYNNEIYYNIIYNERKGINIVGDVYNNVVYNNVIYNSSEYGIIIYDRGSSYTPYQNIIKNNIIYKSSSQLIYSSANLFNANYKNISDYNCFYDSDFTGKFFYGRNYNDLSGWQTATGQDANSYDQDPLFMNPSAHNFHLQYLSPCIDTGINVDISQDYEGNPVPQGGGVDIGAFEYQGETGFQLFNYESTNIIFEICLFLAIAIL